MAITISRDLAFAAGTDAANASMRKAGRKAWSRADYNLCIRTTNKLLLHIPFEYGGLAGLPRKLLLNHLSAADLAAHNAQAA